MNTQPKFTELTPQRLDANEDTVIRTSAFARLCKGLSELRNKRIGKSGEFPPNAQLDKLLAANAELADTIQYTIKKDAAKHGINVPSTYGLDLRRAFLDSMKLVGALKTEIEDLKRKLPPL
jgi:hypothetical protein